MAAAKKPAAAPAASKGKVKKVYHIHTIYDGGKAKNKSCPKCGPGVFLASHKDREACGKCCYTERK